MHVKICAFKIQWHIPAVKFSVADRVGLSMLLVGSLCFAEVESLSHVIYILSCFLLSASLCSPFGVNLRNR